MHIIVFASILEYFRIYSHPTFGMFALRFWIFTIFSSLSLLFILLVYILNGVECNKGATANIYGEQARIISIKGFSK